MDLGLERQRALFFAEVANRNRNTLRLEDVCFDKQLAFIRDPAPFKTAVCSRRAGKTVGCAFDLLRSAKQRARIVNLYITLSRSNAKRIIWPELKRINTEYRMGGIPNESDLSITFPNASVVYVSGAKHASEIEKFRGLAIFKVYVDEAQSFRSYIQDLIDDVLSAALFDYSGTLCLTGTPGPVPAGYFYKCSTNPEWSHHGWTMFDNPWLLQKSGKTPQELLERELKRRGVTIQDPSIQRECFGRWIADLDALVFKYNAEKNHWDTLPQTPKPWQHVFGVDLGFDDSDAIAVIGWNDKYPGSYLREEVVTAKQGITELAQQLEKLIATYDPLAIVMDTGGLGKKIAEEIRRRFNIPIKAAEKQRKFEFIELLNDALRTGKFFAKQDGAFAHDSKLLEWDREKQKELQKLVIRDTYHSDIGDAVLYGYRESLHWLHEPEAPIIEPGSPEDFQKQTDEMEREALARLQEEHVQQPEPLDSWGWG
jgi:hypothetical protein